MAFRSQHKDTFNFEASSSLLRFAFRTIRRRFVSADASLLWKIPGLNNYNHGRSAETSQQAQRAGRQATTGEFNFLFFLISFFLLLCLVPETMWENFKYRAFFFLFFFFWFLSFWSWLWRRLVGCFFATWCLDLNFLLVSQENVGKRERNFEINDEIQLNQSKLDSFSWVLTDSYLMRPRSHLDFACHFEVNISNFVWNFFWSYRKIWVKTLVTYCFAKDCQI